MTRVRSQGQSLLDIVLMVETDRRAPASKHKIMDESPDELVLLPVNRHIRKTYETECLYSAETNPLLEALLEEERSQRLLEEAVAAQRDETRR